MSDTSIGPLWLAQSTNPVFRVWIIQITRLRFTVMRWQALTVINDRMAHKWTFSAVWTRPKADGTPLLNMRWHTRL